MFLSLILERGLATLFEWRMWTRYADGKGLRTPVVFIVALLLCRYMQFDILLLIQGKTGAESWHRTFSIGALLTASVIAGGSKGAILLFQGVLGFGREAIDAKVSLKRGGGGSGRPQPPQLG